MRLARFDGPQTHLVLGQLGGGRRDAFLSRTRKVLDESCLDTLVALVERSFVARILPLRLYGGTEDAISRFAEGRPLVLLHDGAFVADEAGEGGLSRLEHDEVEDSSGDLSWGSSRLHDLSVSPLSRRLGEGVVVRLLVNMNAAPGVLEERDLHFGDPVISAEEVRGNHFAEFLRAGQVMAPSELVDSVLLRLCGNDLGVASGGPRICKVAPQQSVDRELVDFMPSTRLSVQFHNTDLDFAVCML
mmetsp:Transcript_50998/g.159357  ORF Transcript_50998/g.159357 Transcript_50998/m.159357 type:complete len:245 (-) Transcript_50998:33-767(-)